MSYILEALRRSQAERERGQVPGLHAQPATLAPLPAPADNPPVRWLLPLVLVLLGALGLALWAWPGRLPPGGPVAPAGGQAAAPAPQAADPAPQAKAPPAPQPLQQAPLPQVVSAPPAPLPAPAPAPAVQPGPAIPALPPAATAPPRQVAAPVPAPVPPPAAPRTLRLAELSAEQRRDLPPLNLGGAVWSESALSRFVIVNGQVVREGDVAAPGVVVERIAPKAVLLRWRELLLEVPI